MAKVGFNTAKFIKKHFKGLKQALVVVSVIAILLILPKIAAPLLKQIFVDNIISGLNPEWAVAFMCFASFIVLFEFVTRLIESNTWKIQLRMTISATTELIWHLLRLPMDYFHDKYAGDLAYKSSFPSDISNLLINKLIPVIQEFILIVVYLFFMIRYNLYLTAFAIIHIFLSIVILRVVAKKRKRLNKEMDGSMGELQGFTTSCIENIEAIKGCGAEYGFFQRWANQFSSAQNAAVRYNSQDVILTTLPLILQAIADVCVLGLGAYYIIEGNLTVGMLMAFQGFISACMSAMNRISSRFQIWTNIRTKTEFIDDIYKAECDIPSDFDDQRPVVEGKLRGGLELRDVTFGYNREVGPLISNFNLKIEPGKSVAFVGQSGCGKTTLAKLIVGLYQPWSGKILFDGKTKGEINRKVFNNSVSVIDQNIVLFDGTISDNIKLWDDSIEDFAMILASHQAQIHNEIVSRKQAYNTVMENGGRNFSGGQRQRIELASALAKEPVILVMDEGTSALDSITEAKLMKEIKKMGITLVLIAHRLSTIRDCDEIIVMEKGHVVERGEHEQLLKNGGLYCQLMNSN